MGDDFPQFRFFRGWARIRFPAVPDGQGPVIDFGNVDQVCGCIIGEGIATLHELRTIYTLEDAMRMQEVIMVRRSNEFLATQTR